MSLVPANDIYPALPQGTQASTALNSYQLTISRQGEAIVDYVSSAIRATGSVPQFNSYDEYLKFKMATFANRSDPRQ